MVRKRSREEARGLRANTRRYRRKAAWDDFLPPPIVRIVNWLLELGPRSLGFQGPGRQLTAGLAFMIATLLLFPILFPLLPVFAIVVLVGLLRFFPTVEHYWPLTGDEYVRRN